MVDEKAMEVVAVKAEIWEAAADRAAAFEARLHADDLNRGIVIACQVMFTVHGWPVPEWVALLEREIEARRAALEAHVASLSEGPVTRTTPIVH